MVAPQPFYFGPSHHPLFGVYHPAQAAADRDLGVLLCAPIGREYLRTHRALRQLSLRLSRAGFHSLRFDYRGCGDSAGEPEGLALDDWAADVGVAADELKDRAGLGRLAFVGLRLGGTLALLAASGRRDVDGLVLWEAVLDGPGYLAEIRAADEARRRGLGIAATPPDEQGTVGVLGFPIGKRLQQGLESLAVTPARRPARRALVLRDHDIPEDARLLEDLRRLGVAAEGMRAATARIWLDGDDEARALVPTATFEKAVSWLEGDAA